ncbi:MAG: GGDEF domain-containing protein [Gammaproteobacteria bacterium]|nr:GGDEF domain-containing protein [Gammaproteobacteria bacterium]
MVETVDDELEINKWKNRYFAALEEQEAGDVRWQQTGSALTDALDASMQAWWLNAPRAERILKRLRKFPADSQWYTAVREINQFAAQQQEQREQISEVFIDCCKALLDLALQQKVSFGQKYRLNRLYKQLSKSGLSIENISALLQQILEHWPKTTLPLHQERAPDNDHLIDDAKLDALDTTYTQTNSAALNLDSETLENALQICRKLVQKCQETGVSPSTINGLQAWLETPTNLPGLLHTITDAFNEALQTTQQEFSGFLQDINARLAEFRQLINQSQVAGKESLSDSSHLHDALRTHIETINHNVSTAKNLDGLKQAINAHLAQIEHAMTHFQEKQNSRDHELHDKVSTLFSRLDKMEQQSTQLLSELTETRAQHQLDSLTKVPNRQTLDERLKHEVMQAQLHNKSLVLAVLDVDFFKKVNDQYGHLAGDKVLRAVGKVLNKNLRPNDFVARYGGEEFVMLMPHTPMEAATHVCERLRLAIADCPFHSRGARVPITVSMGITDYRMGETPEQCFKRADQALYQAKNTGRNRVVSG